MAFTIMRIVFFGTGEVAVPSLTQLAHRGHQIIRCVTQPDRPKGRGLKLASSPIKQAAASLGLPLEEATDWSVILAGVQAMAPEVGVAIDYGRILPSTLLRLPPHGFFGVHPSLLPKYRGSSPVASAILHGEADTGVTVFRLNERMDAGDMAAQERLAIGAEETTDTLTPKLAKMGAELLCQAFDRLAAGRLQLSPQDERMASTTSKFEKADGRLEWAQPAAAIDRRIRAMQPWPGAWTLWRRLALQLLRARPMELAPASARPGEVIEVGKQGIVVATGQGALRIEELQASGGRRMPARDFLAGHDLRVGEMLGEGMNA